MSIKRRSFLKSMLVAGVAPAVIGSGILMPIRKLIVPSSEIELAPNITLKYWIRPKGKDWSMITQRVHTKNARIPIPLDGAEISSVEYSWIEPNYLTKTVGYEKFI